MVARATIQQIYTPVVFHKMNKKLKLWELDRAADQEFKSQGQYFQLRLYLDSIRSLTNVGALSSEPVTPSMWIRFISAA